MTGNIRIDPPPATAAGCASCSAANMAGLRKLGIDMENVDYVVALAGNPNTGKSTIFNAVAGYRSATANFPGSSVTTTIRATPSASSWRVSAGTLSGPGSG